MKKIGAVALSAMLCASMAPVAWADEINIDDSWGGETVAFDAKDALPNVENGMDNGGKATWSFIDGTLTLDGQWPASTSKFKKSTVLPYCDKATKIVVGENFYSAGFAKIVSKCSNAKEIVFPATITTLPELVHLINLEKISFPDGCNITSIDPAAFCGYWDQDLKRSFAPKFDIIDMSEMSVVEIPYAAFRYANASKIILPSCLENINATAFIDMPNLEEIEIPSSVKKLGTGHDTGDFKQLFAGSTSLKTIVMYDTIETVEGPLFDTRRGSEYTTPTTIKIMGTNKLSDSLYQALFEVPSDPSKTPNPVTVEFQQVFNVNPDRIEAIADNVQPVGTQWVEMGTGLDAAGAEASNAPVLSCDGYTFTGWYSDAECTTSYDFTAPMEHGAVAYAGWKQIVSVDVNYGNGSENGTITADENDMIAKPDTDPVRAGYKFTGWFSDEACTTEFDFTKPVVDGACLYAGWTPVKAIVSNVDGTKTDLQVKSDGTIAEPMAPTRDGYVFKGWYSDPYCTRAFDFEQPLYDDVTLYSKWEAKASEPTPTGGTTDTGNTGSGGNAKQPAAQPNGSQNGNGIQQTNSASNAGAQTLAQTGDAATGAVPAVAFVSAMAAAVVAFARKRIARR